MLVPLLLSLCSHPKTPVPSGKLQGAHRAWHPPLSPCPPGQCLFCSFSKPLLLQLSLLLTSLLHLFSHVRTASYTSPTPHDPERIQHGVLTCHPLLHPPPTLSNFRVLKIYIHLLPSLVPIQHPATQSSSQPPYTTMLCPWLLQFSEHSCLVFSNKNNRPISLHLFSHIYHSHLTPKLQRMMLPHCFKLLGNTPYKTMWHLRRPQSSMLWKPETLQNY